MSNHAKNLSFTLPATLESVETISLRLREHMTAQGLAGDLFACELVLREALTNAVLHGAKSDKNKSIHCRIRFTTKSVRMDIIDPGPGFDWRQALKHHAKSIDTRGRGHTIFAAYATKLAYNQKGNHVTLRRKIQHPIAKPDTSFRA